MARATRHVLIARAGLATIAVNFTLTLLRATAGWLEGSTAVLADAANSGTDILATLVVLGGTRIAAIPADPDHPYGHEKAEPAAAKFVGGLVAFTGAVAAFGALRALRMGGTETVGLTAILVTLLSIGTKEVLARFLVRTATVLNSPALLADAANQRTDVLASLAALVGVLGSRFGLPILDPAMGLVVASLIIWMGITLYWRALNDLLDRAPSPEVMATLERAAASVRGVLAVDEVKARVFGSGVYVDSKIGVDAAATVAEGHQIAGQVKQAIFEAVPEAKDVLVHVNPFDPPDVDRR